MKLCYTRRIESQLVGFILPFIKQHKAIKHLFLYSLQFNWLSCQCMRIFYITKSVFSYKNNYWHFRQHITKYVTKTHVLKLGFYNFNWLSY